MDKENIVTIIGKHVKLKKLGKYYWGLCQDAWKTIMGINKGIGL